MKLGITNTPCTKVFKIDNNISKHLYYAFAGIDSSTWEIESLYANDEQYWAEFVALKKKKSALKTFISVGGWDFGGKVFSDLASFPGSRKEFINSAISFMEKWGFDDGKDVDTENFVTLLKELKAACGSTYGITATLPSSYWYMKGFDIVLMAEYVDHFNFMAYDIHGIWDVNPYTNLTEISEGLDLLWRNDIEPSKVLLGLGFYGRSSTLADSSCKTPGCAFDTSEYMSGGGAPGEYIESSGILSDYEINRIIDEYSPTIEYDESAAVN
ncbi:hypothetical protein N7495_005172 [Penicillium taxi]|uniref:uncharacterized protein n=1 Tax=Penicillium taxi TaxID=168475 RepID=UPI0025453412|nr:uncharacterized protein N7495_005172 [Penicillium taxi]KAJ5893481.1 hypothetical protein N7495_005172 [Penicillium taxi]